MKCNRIIALATIMLMLAVFGVAQADVLFSDSFDTTIAHSTDLNFEFSGARQSGLVGPLMYDEPAISATAPFDYETMVNRTDNPGALWMYPGQEPEGGLNTTWVSPRHNFIESGSFEISFDVNPVAPGSHDSASQDQWVGLIFGTAEAGQWITSSDGIAVIFRGNAKSYAWDNTSGLGEVVYTPHALPTDYYHVSVVVTDGASSNIKIYIDGTLLYEINRPSGFTANRITLCANAGSYLPTVNLFDNFQVTATPPASGPYAPTFTTKPGTYYGVASVKIACADAAATIRYTTDNSEPTTTNGVDYSGPITITESTTFKARAFNAGVGSATTTGTYTIAGTLVFSDNFNTSAASNDVNFENDLGRQSGSAGVLAYLERGDTADPNNWDIDSKTRVNSDSPAGTLALNATNGMPDLVWVSPNHNFTESGSFEVAFDVSPVFFGTDPTLWLGVNIGGSTSGAAPYETDGTGFIFRGSGVIRYWDRGVVNPDEIPTTAHSGFYHVQIVVDAADFGGSDANVKVYVDGTKYVDITRAGGYSGNRITLTQSNYSNGSAASTSAVDNFSVSATGLLVPSFNPAPGNYVGAVDVTMLYAADATATLRYTTDNSDPSLENGTTYTGPVTITSNTTFKVKAFKDGSESPTATGTYTVSGGVLFSDNFDTTVGTYDLNAELAIRESGLLAPLTYSEKAEAGDPGNEATNAKSRVNWTDGPGALVLEATTGGMPDIVWVRPNHNFVESGNFEITFDTSIFYTIDPNMWMAVIFGDSNGATAPYDTNGIGLFLRANAGLRYWDNGVTTGEVQVAPHSGMYKVRVTVDTADFSGGSAANVKVYVDGTKYIDFVRPGGFTGNNVVLLVANYGTASNATMCAIDNFKIAGASVSAPIFTPPSGFYSGTVNVSMASLVPGATVRYTTDGSDPTATTGTLYTGPIPVSSDTSFRAKAFMAGWAESSVAIGSYSFVTKYNMSQLKPLADNTPMHVSDGIVTAAFNGYFYMEDDARTVGIKVVKAAHGLVVGDRADVGGTITTGSDHERYIEAASAVKIGTGAIAPLGMTNKVIGGGDFEYNSSTGAGQQGVAGASGLNNIGLLVKVWGQVTSKNGSTFTITDGSGFDLKVAVPGDTAAPETGYYTITGISSCEDASGSVSSVIKVRNQDDLEAVPVGTILFSDDFDTSVGSVDVNFEYNLGRQSGGLAPFMYAESYQSTLEGGLDYKTQVSNVEYPGKLFMRGGLSGGDFVWVSPDHSFTESGNFEIWCKMNPVVAGSDLSGDYWVGMEFGSLLSGQRPWVTDGIGMLLRRNGKIIVWDGGDSVVSDVQTVAHPGTASQVRITVESPGFVGGDAVVKVYVDGINYATFTRDEGFGSNFVTLCLQDDTPSWHTHTVDNFTVLIPD